MVTAKARAILVIEDDDSMRQAIARLLRAADFECDVHASAEKLLARGGGSDAAGIVCDLKLPGISGLELLDELRARGGCPPFVLITAHDARGLRAEALQRGAAAYLAKPFRGTALLEVLNSVVPGHVPPLAAT